MTMACSGIPMGTVANAASKPVPIIGFVYGASLN